MFIKLDESRWINLEQIREVYKSRHHYGDGEFEDFLLITWANGNTSQVLQESIPKLLKALEDSSKVLFFMPGKI